MSKVKFANSIDIQTIYKDYYKGASKTNEKGNVLCPFHEDSNASMKLYPKNNKAKCFGCGFYGGPIDFVLHMKYNGEQARFTDVVEELCQQYGYVEENDPEIIHNSNKIRNPEAYEQKVSYTSDLKKLVDFLNKGMPTSHNYFMERGIPTNVQNQYGLGYFSPDLIPNNQANLSNLIKAGVSTINNDLPFKGRWIIPIKDQYGNVVALGGRSLQPDQPKYINSPDNEYFHKGEIFWNFDVAKKYDTIIIVEGFMDALSLITAGIPNVVALMGCNVSDEQMKLLKDKNIILSLDNDLAGQRAMYKIINKYKGIQFHVIDFKDLTYKDFNDILIKEGIKTIQGLLNQQMIGIEWAIRTVAKHNDVHLIEQKEKLWKILAGLIGSREPEYRGMYPVNISYSPIMFTELWRIFDELTN